VADDYGAWGRSGRPGGARLPTQRHL